MPENAQMAATRIVLGVVVLDTPAVKIKPKSRILNGKGTDEALTAGGRTAAAIEALSSVQIPLELE